jgi:hypothetical protein
MNKRMRITRSWWPPFFGIDLKSYYRSIWIGWWLITWCEDAPHNVHVSFNPD